MSRSSFEYGFETAGIFFSLVTPRVTPHNVPPPPRKSDLMASRLGSQWVTQKVHQISWEIMVFPESDRQSENSSWMKSTTQDPHNPCFHSAQAWRKTLGYTVGSSLNVKPYLEQILVTIQRTSRGPLMEQIRHKKSHDAVILLPHRRGSLEI